MFNQRLDNQDYTKTIGNSNAFSKYQDVHQTFPQVNSSIFPSIRESIIQNVRSNVNQNCSLKNSYVKSNTQIPKIIFHSTTPNINYQANTKILNQQEQIPFNYSIGQKIISPVQYIQGPNNIQNKYKLQIQILEHKYEDLKQKYNILVQKQQNDNRWMIQQENALLKQKIRLLQSRDQKFYSQMQAKFIKIVQYHRQTTLKQCQLLVDRYRLQSKLSFKKNQF